MSKIEHALLQRSGMHYIKLDKISREFYKMRTKKRGTSKFDRKISSSKSTSFVTLDRVYLASLKRSSNLNEWRRHHSLLSIWNCLQENLCYTCELPFGSFVSVWGVKCCYDTHMLCCTIKTNISKSRKRNRKTKLTRLYKKERLVAAVDATLVSFFSKDLRVSTAWKQHIHIHSYDFMILQLRKQTQFHIVYHMGSVTCWKSFSFK